VIPVDDAGRTRGQQDAAKTPVADFDADCRAGLDWLSKHPKVASGKIGAVGVSASAATSPSVLHSSRRRATVCYYELASMTASSVRTQMPDRWPAQKKFAVNS